MRDVVLLIGYGATGDVIVETSISYDRYYEDLHPLIDEEQYRALHGIRRLKGDIYDFSGELQSHFENEYDQAGIIFRGRTVHSDGTVTET